MEEIQGGPHGRVLSSPAVAMRGMDDKPCADAEERAANSVKARSVQVRPQCSHSSSRHFFVIRALACYLSTRTISRRCNMNPRAEAFPACQSLGRLASFSPPPMPPHPRARPTSCSRPVEKPIDPCCPDPFCAILDESIEPLVRPQCSHSSSRHFFVIRALACYLSTRTISRRCNMNPRAEAFPACQSLGRLASFSPPPMPPHPRARPTSCSRPVEKPIDPCCPDPFCAILDESIERFAALAVPLRVV